MKKFFRQFGAILLSALILFSLIPGVGVSAATTWEAPNDKTGIKARFAWFSDAHLQNDMSRLKLALNAYRDIGGIDGMLLGGDIVYHTSTTELNPERYDNLFNTIASYPTLPQKG